MKRFFALLLAICLALSLSVGASAAGEKQHDYSTAANSGIRHEVCTSLLGTNADRYYTGSCTYDALSNLDSDELLTALRALMTDTHTRKSTYNNCRDMAVLTDCENADGTTVSLIYTSYIATWADWCNNRDNDELGWNREHVWPQNLGGFKTDGPGADLHHVRPSDQPVNSVRGNKKYGNVSGGSTAKGADYTGNAVGGTYNSTYFEPLDNVKGDVARICLYVYVRYGGSFSKCASITNVFESVDVLLEWCAMDPVDTWEMGRNEVVAAFQGNRNVFIDYPELAWLLFDEDIPTDMATPSGAAANDTPCAHSATAVKNTSAATCAESGYTGDIYCADCGEKLSGGSAIPATGAHTYGSWTVTEEPTTQSTGTRTRSCTVCGHAVTEEIPKLDPPATEPPATEPPVTEPPATQPPVTEPPVTEPTVTEPTITEPTVTEPTATEPTVTDPTVTEPSATGPSEPGPQEEDDSTVLWIVICAVGAVACGIVAVVLLCDKKKK